MSAKRKYFGTDGIRGVANANLMNPEFVLKLGQAATKVLLKDVQLEAGKKPVCYIGRDTRRSGQMLQYALAAGLNSQGVDVVFLGEVPTPAVAYLVAKDGASFGVVVSASHNPYIDNGIKFIAGSGYKLTDAQEFEIEALLEDPTLLDQRPILDGVGSCSCIPNAAERYAEHAVASMSGVRLDGMKIALDNSNGAASFTSERALKALGADVEVIESSPDGLNINEDCGCTHPEKIIALTKSSGANVGLAHDGDADRLVLIDETGSLLSGDELIAIVADHMIKDGSLKENTLVVTIMSNYGLDSMIANLGGSVIRTSVGDRYVIEEMRQKGFNFGAEESGHVVFLDHITTGDGLISALQVFKIMALTGKPLSELRKCLSPFPQAKRNLRVTSKPPEEELVEAQKWIQETEVRLNGLGRVLLRYSGTEPIIRLLIEGQDESFIEEQAEKIALAIQSQIGA